MTLSRFGSRMQQRLDEAAEAAREKEEALKNLTPEDHISRIANGIEAGEKVAQNLSQALAKALNDKDTAGRCRFYVDAAHHLMNDEYLVRITMSKDEDVDGWLETGRPRRKITTVQTWKTVEETLARNTLSVAQFQSWVINVARSLKVMFGVSEPKGRPLGSKLPDKFEAQYILEHAGFLPVSLEPTPEELDAAMESIRKAMG